MQKLRDAVDSIKGRVDNQSGRWIILCVVLVSALGWIGAAVNDIGESTGKTAAAVVSIDKTMAVYIASSSEQISQLAEQIAQINREIADIKSIL
jgi:hypothetical protein